MSRNDPVQNYEHKFSIGKTQDESVCCREEKIAIEFAQT
jgi:hypothetical protein